MLKGRSKICCGVSCPLTGEEMVRRMAIKREQKRGASGFFKMESLPGPVSAGVGAETFRYLYR
jgi:hypothetical protein